MVNDDAKTIFVPCGGMCAVYSKPLKPKSVMHGNNFGMFTCLPCPFVQSCWYCARVNSGRFWFQQTENPWTSMNIHEQCWASVVPSQKTRRILCFFSSVALWKLCTWRCLVVCLWGGSHRILQRFGPRNMEGWCFVYMCFYGDLCHVVLWYGSPNTSIAKL